eukprot:752855-Hanusia_phi.AAC.1
MAERGSKEGGGGGRSCSRKTRERMGYEEQGAETKEEQERAKRVIIRGDAGANVLERLFIGGVPLNVNNRQIIDRFSAFPLLEVRQQHAKFPRKVECDGHVQVKDVYIARLAAGDEASNSK